MGGAPRRNGIHGPFSVHLVARTRSNAHSLLWAMMIASAANRRWPDDLAIGDLKSAGLPAPSVIRTAKIATIEAADAAKLGRVPQALFRQVASRLSANLGI